MEDTAILDRLFQRDENAIADLSAKYGPYCRTIARNILGSEADAEEVLSDTWLKAWNAIPPQRPDNLSAWLGAVVRNGAYNLWKREHRQKRNSGLDVMLDELAECLPAPDTPEDTLDGKALTEELNRWLGSLPKEDRKLFVRRYWYGESVAALARAAGYKPAQMAKKMYQLRRNLKQTLERNGYTI